MAFRPKILVVDDDPLMLDLFQEGLTRAGGLPRCVQSSPRAVEILNAEKFDGVFLDWQMPEMDGLEVAKQVRWSRSNSLCPMVMITANTEPGAMGQCFRAGINFFLQKPVSLDQIQKVAKNAWDLMLQERLRYQRVPVQIPVTCTYKIQSLRQQADGRSANLSTTGMLLRLDKAVAPGTTAVLRFELPRDPEPFELSAMVVRSTSDGGIGVRLINLTREERWRLMNFSKSVLGESLGPEL